MNMMFIVDVECFQVNGKLVAKEIAVINMKYPGHDAGHAMLTLRTHPTSRKDLRTARYLTQHHHRLPMVTPQDQSSPPYVPDGSIIFMTGGRVKRECIKSLYPQCHVLDVGIPINMTNATCPCKFRRHLKCAYKKAVILYAHLF